MRSPGSPGVPGRARVYRLTPHRIRGAPDAVRAARRACGRGHCHVVLSSSVAESESSANQTGVALAARVGQIPRRSDVVHRAPANDRVAPHTPRRLTLPTRLVRHVRVTAALDAGVLDPGRGDPQPSPPPTALKSRPPIRLSPSLPARRSIFDLTITSTRDARRSPSRSPACRPAGRRPSTAAATSSTASPPGRASAGTRPARRQRARPTPTAGDADPRRHGARRWRRSDVAADLDPGRRAGGRRRSRSRPHPDPDRRLRRLSSRSP